MACATLGVRRRWQVVSIDIPQPGRRSLSLRCHDAPAALTRHGKVPSSEHCLSSASAQNPLFPPRCYIRIISPTLAYLVHSCPSTPRVRRRLWGWKQTTNQLDAGVAQRRSLRIHSISRLGPHPAGLALVLASSLHAARLRVTQIHQRPCHRLRLSRSLGTCHGARRHSRLTPPLVILTEKWFSRGRFLLALHLDGLNSMYTVPVIVSHVPWTPLLGRLDGGGPLGFEGSDP